MDDSDFGKSKCAPCPETKRCSCECNETGRIVNPFNTDEQPTFLPGDKVADVRDASGKIWRIVRRVAHEQSELMTLREVGDDSNEISVLSDQLVPHLRMIAMLADSPPVVL